MKIFYQANSNSIFDNFVIWCVCMGLYKRSYTKKCAWTLEGNDGLDSKPSEEPLASRSRPKDPDRQKEIPRWVWNQRQNGKISLPLPFVSPFTQLNQQ